MMTDEPRAMPISVWILIGTLVIGVGCLVAGIRLPIGTISHPGYGLLPVITGVLLIAASAVSLLETLKRKAIPGKPKEETQKTATKEESQTSRLRPLLILGAIFTYLFLAGVVGHALVAAVVAVIVLLTTGKRPWWQIVLYGVLIGLFSWLLFDLLLRVRLPRGLIF